MIFGWSMSNNNIRRYQDSQIKPIPGPFRCGAVLKIWDQNRCLVLYGEDLFFKVSYKQRPFVLSRDGGTKEFWGARQWRATWQEMAPACHLACQWAALTIYGSASPKKFSLLPAYVWYYINVELCHSIPCSPTH
jgi:hypothetical protein